MTRAASRLAALAVVAAVAAGCGGSSSDDESATSAGTAPTAPPPSLPATANAPAAPAIALGEDHLPARDAVSGLRGGSLRGLPSARDFVDALYQAGDPAKPGAVARLAGGGYTSGVLRDQVGLTPATGITLFRAYALGLRDPDAARAEVDAAIAEVEGSTALPTTDLALPGVPDARGLRVVDGRGGPVGAVAFVTFSSGSVVYGLQGVSTSAATLQEDEIVGAARALYERVAAAP